MKLPADYTPPTKGRIIINGTAVQYTVGDRKFLYDPRPGTVIVLEVSVPVGGRQVSYAFSDGRCVSMRDMRKYGSDHPKFLHGRYLEGMQEARDRLQDLLVYAERRDIPGNVQSFLRNGLGIEEKVAA